MENERLRAELERAQTEVRTLLEQATTDELTGLLNRRGFLRLAELELRRARDEQQSLTLVYIDVDGLKTLNDEAGHEAGDALLVETAALLRTAFRSTDVVARLGGDEFVVLTRGFHGDGAVMRHRIKRMSQELHRSGAQTREISLSTGVILATPSVAPDLEDLLNRADKAMYEIKQAKSGPYRGRQHLPAPALLMAM
ncbi:GGDEF domain-containing protein [Rhodanobacter sp. AS-Z3]|uniref:GGDEF domain-containing protein n=1 Tax=Rhodanobacter sp. AS-Z3 TaxID=3031330 RepID=UPI00247A4DDC|nr:GGDEF domain-containing protein [Rhodanobacter sp. AS-Z3]WEN14007.1 GGDEF domain-containing protein [Rhodanobacter sp. AS-Z3]